MTVTIPVFPLIGQTGLPLSNLQSNFLSLVWQMEKERVWLPPQGIIVLYTRRKIKCIELKGYV